MRIQRVNLEKKRDWFSTLEPMLILVIYVVHLVVHPPVSSSLYKKNTNELENRGDLQNQIVFFSNFAALNFRLK